MDRFDDRIVEYLRQDKVLPHLLRVVVGLLRHWICDVIIAVLGTIVIAVLVSKNSYGLAFWIIVVVYISLLLGSTYCKRYENKKKMEIVKSIDDKERELKRVQANYDQMNDTKLRIASINGIAAKGVYRVARDIKQDGWRYSIKEIRDIIGFQAVAFTVCREVYEFFHVNYGLDGHWVTLFQRFDEKKRGRVKSICKMIAYHNQADHEPLSYQNTYTIPRNDNAENVEFHTRIFAGTDLTPRILMTQEDVRREFKIHPQSSARENRIHQYIGIPGTVCTDGITFLLQVDCNIVNGFGRDLKDVQELATKILSQYITVLTLYYELDRFNEIGTRYVQGLKLKAEGVK